MKFTLWLEKKEMKAPKFAQLVFTNKATVYSWINGKYVPSRHFQKLIEYITEGEVSSKDWES